MLHNLQKYPDFLSSIKIDDIIIKWVKCAKYLGLTLDTHLNWQEHIKDINISLTKIGNYFKIIKHQMHECNKLLMIL